MYRNVRKYTRIACYIEDIAKVSVTSKLNQCQSDKYSEKCMSMLAFGVF